MFRCPSCQSTFVRPVPPTLLGRLRLRFSKRYPWECWHCGWRGWLTDQQVRSGDEQAPPAASGTDPAASSHPGPNEPNRRITVA